MISIVVCSRDESLLARLTKNIAETIGVEHEIIEVNNGENQFGICEAYNKGATKSIYDFLVFVHEDVTFLSFDWGKTIIKNLINIETGLIGVAGATVKSVFPTSWVDVPPKYYRTNIWASQGGQKRISIIKSSPDEQTSEVAVLDGMFLCTRKEVWRQYPFDEKRFKAFNLYDLDISMAIGTKFKLLVSHEVLLEHFSPGNFNESWFTDSVRFALKWKKNLPKICDRISLGEWRTIQHYSVLQLISHLTMFKRHDYTSARYYFLLFWYRPFSRLNFVIVLRGLKLMFR